VPLSRDDEYDAPFDVFIQKPFRMAELLEKVGAFASATYAK